MKENSKVILLHNKLPRSNPPPSQVNILQPSSQLTRRSLLESLAPNQMKSFIIISNFRAIATRMREYKGMLNRRDNIRVIRPTKRKRALSRSINFDDYQNAKNHSSHGHTRDCNQYAFSHMFSLAIETRLQWGGFEAAMKWLYGWFSQWWWGRLGFSTSSSSI